MIFIIIRVKIFQILFPSNFYNVRIPEIFKSYFMKVEKQYLLKILKNKISQYI